MAKAKGKMSLATKIQFDEEANMIGLEDYQTQPVLLKSVRQQAAR